MAAKPPVSARPSLSNWLFVCVTTALVAAVLTCAVLIDRFSRAEAHEQAQRFLRINADALRDALDRGMAQHYEEVHVLSKLPVLTQPQDPAGARRVLEDVRSSFPHFAWIGLTDARGRVLAAADGLLEGADVSARPWFRGAMQGSFVGDVHAAVLLEKLLPKQPEPWRFVDVAVPIFNAGGELQGVLGAHLSWAWAGQIKRELVDRAIERYHAEALVLSADGTVLLGPPALQGRKLDAAVGHLVAVSQTRGAGRYPGLGWKVMLRQPEAVALEGFRDLERRMLWATGLLCVLLAPLAWLLARRLSAPLLELTAALDTGRVRQPAAHPLYREAEVLGEALRTYAERQAEDASRLQQLNSSLQQRVDERTAALAASEQRLRTIADNMPGLIAYVDREERFRFCNATYGSWMGLDLKTVIGQPLREALGEEQYAQRVPLLKRVLAGERCDFDTSFTRNGVVRHLHTIYLPDVSGEGVVHGLYALSIDISQMKTAEDQLKLTARTDTLTGLPNRLYFNEKLAEALARSRRRRQPIALLFLDVDKFKGINDVLGHAAGDEVLKTFGARLSASVRETDTVARLAGDEFVVILEDLHTEAESQFVARKILAAINRPFHVLGRELDVSTSIGIAFHAEGSALPEQLLSAADKALYQAKNERNTFCFSVLTLGRTNAVQASDTRAP